MSGLFRSIGRKVLFSLDPEDAHGLSIKALKTGLVPGCYATQRSGAARRLSRA